MVFMRLSGYQSYIITDYKIANSIEIPVVYLFTLQMCKLHVLYIFNLASFEKTYVIPRQDHQRMRSQI